MVLYSLKLKGFYLFYQGLYDNALVYFENAHEYHPRKNAVAAYIGQVKFLKSESKALRKACINFQRKKYETSLKFLLKACKLNPRILKNISFGNCCSF